MHSSSFSRSIRNAAYHTLDEWCKTSTYGSGVEAIAEDLVQQILQDITPYQNAVTLKVLSGSKKHLSKKARKTLQKAQNDATNMAQTHSKAFNPHNTKVICTDEGNEQLCATALNCLIDVLLASGCFLKPVMHKVNVFYFHIFWNAIFQNNNNDASSYKNISLHWP